MPVVPQGWRQRLVQQRKVVVGQIQHLQFRTSPGCCPVQHPVRDLPAPAPRPGTPNHHSDLHHVRHSLQYQRLAQYPACGLTRYRPARISGVSPLKAVPHRQRGMPLHPCRVLLFHSVPRQWAVLEDPLLSSMRPVAAISRMTWIPRAAACVSLYCSDSASTLPVLSVSLAR